MELQGEESGFDKEIEILHSKLSENPICIVCRKGIDCHTNGCDICSDPCIEILIKIVELGMHGYLYIHDSGNCLEELKQQHLKPISSSGGV
ncbi:MAG: hypothetical protein V3R82_06770 [Candidatus Hydrothermarchaeales archaeon]